MKALIVCLDGCDPEYIKGDLPNFSRLERSFGLAVVPTTTNVNAVSIVTGKYPKDHGITSNFYYDKRLKRAYYMESPDFILAESIFERASRMGLRSAMVTAKEKLRKLLSRGVDLSFSAEAPAGWIVDEVGPPPSIYSAEVNSWLFASFLEVLKGFNPDLSLLMTTDYVMHKFPPRSEEARRSMEALDRWLGRLIDYLESQSEEFLLFLTADHGMSEKSRGIDPEKLLRSEGIEALSVPIIRDRYVLHHSNLGGASYIYLREDEEVDRALEVLSSVDGVEEALSREEAVSLYNLHPDRIGDIFLLGEEDVVFGKGEGEFFQVNLRSHGSLHEREIPIFSYGGPFNVKENKDIAPLVLDWLIG